jgi:uncharacterized membrane protein YdjX (TVP38/TMEM64 family)
MSEPMPREKKQMLIKLTVLGVIIATVAVFMLSGIDIKARLDQGIQIIREAGPVMFFTALAVLPAVGCPLSFFTLPAGSVFAPELGMPLVLLLVCASIAVNLAITYWLSRHLFRPWLIKLLAWLGYKLPEVSAKNHRVLVFLVRVTPGPPYVLQSYLLGLAGIPFVTYFIISWIISSSYACAFVLFGDALMHGRGKMALMAIGLFVALTVGVQLLRKHYARKQIKP